MYKIESSDCPSSHATIFRPTSSEEFGVRIPTYLEECPSNRSLPPMQRSAAPFQGAADTQVSEVRETSRKPDEIYNLIACALEKFVSRLVRLCLRGGQFGGAGTDTDPATSCNTFALMPRPYNQDCKPLLPEPPNPKPKTLEERMFPNCQKLELFGGGPNLAWHGIRGVSRMPSSALNHAYSPFLGIGPPTSLVHPKRGLRV